MIQGRDDALAYALARLPATYAACAAVLRRGAADRARTSRPPACWTPAAGPGGGSWAAREAWPSLRPHRLAGRQPAVPRPGRPAGRRRPAAGPRAEARRGDLTAGGFPGADLVLASYALAEIAPAAQAAVVAALWDACDGVLALVEPGTPAGYARILAARDVLIAAGARILAPCPHEAACPLAAPDWCHFSVRLPRWRDHRLAKAAEVPFEDEKFAYLLAARPHVAADVRRPRVLARPRAGKPGIELKLCGPRAWRPASSPAATSPPTRAPAGSTGATWSRIERRLQPASRVGNGTTVAASSASRRRPRSSTLRSSCCR